MALHQCEAYWQEFQRLTIHQKDSQIEKRKLQAETANELASHIHDEENVIQYILQYFQENETIQEKLQRVSSIPYIKRIIYNHILISAPHSPSTPCNEASEIPKNFQEYIKSKEFQEWIENDSQFNIMIDNANEELNEDPISSEQIIAELNQSIKDAQNLKNKASRYTFSRSWKDLPANELAERLSKGEICPRDEWIPGVSDEKKRILLPHELKGHLEFGDKVLNEGREAFKAKDYKLAYMRFRQVVEMFNWVGSKDDNSEHDIQSKLRIALNNSAITALQLDQYQDCIRACTQVIQDIDSHDGKARYRRGMAYTLLGMAKSAKDDFIFIIKSPFATESDIQSAKHGLRKLRDVLSRASQDTAKWIKKSVSRDIFSKDRSNSMPVNVFSSSIEHDDMCSTTETVTQETEAPPLDENTTRDILIDLLNEYTSDENRLKLEKAHAEAEYDMRRALIRIKKILPPIQQSIFQKYELNDKIHSKNLTKFQKSVSYWRKIDSEIDALAADCLEAIFGDTMDV